MAKKSTLKSIVKYASLLFVVCALATAGAHDFAAPFDDSPSPDDDTAATTTINDSLHFPIEDKQNLDPSSSNNTSTIDLNNPANIHDSISYNPDDSTFNFRQQVGGYDIKNPTYMDYDDYMNYRAQQDENDYWMQKMQTLDMFNQKPKLPTLYREGLFNRLFGGTGISIKPQGNISLTFGGSWQNMKNPSLPQRSQRYGIFDFDMQMNLSLLAQIGDKVKLNITNNTKPTFGEQQKRKLGYTGKEDEIIKKIELGNVDFPLKSTLMTGPRSLFGVKTQLQFGKLWITGVLSQQKSQMKSITVQNGGQAQEFEITADNYDENRNFLLGQYFYNNYDQALANFPLINSQVHIDKIQVWITNRSGVTQGVRDVMAFMDLGEHTPYLATLNNPSGSTLPDNRSNSLYDMLQQSPGTRTQSLATQSAINLGLSQGQDFQRNTMRQLNPSEYSFQPQLGYLSLNTQVNSDDVLAVAYRYTYNGKVYQVGEFAEDMTPDSTNQKVLFLKLLKGISNTPRLPIWKLMMKNVYSLGLMSVTKDKFQLNVFYQDPGGGEKRYLPEGPDAGKPIINLLNLDRLNYNNDPSPDGVFDYVEGITINSQQGKIIFPVLEPFGKDLKPALGGNAQLEKKYLYQVLYDSTKTIAQQFQQNNRFVIKGSAMSANGGGAIYLGFNIPEGSVSVVAGGTRLTENVDYQVDYSVGTVKILNQGILSSGVPITIQFEDNGTFGFVQQNFTGLHLDYFANNNLSIGATYMRLTERPFTSSVSFGDDPIKNTMLGINANYQSELPGLTRSLDKLPLISTTVPSFISASGEVAGIFPGHQRFINIPGDKGGTVFMDNFEGANSNIDLKNGISNWTLASTPFGAKDANGNTLFPESSYSNDVRYGFGRAKMAWYNIEPTLVDGTMGTPGNIKADTFYQDYWRTVDYNEIFPQGNRPTYQSGLSTFDIGFYPHERGPYNFDVSNIDPTTGQFTNPEKRWAGIQRAIEYNTDFEAGNVEYITFWVLDPYIYNQNSAGGDLYFNLGNVSEDVLKDSRISFENGITYPKDISKLDKTNWGYVPKFQQQITRSFDNDPDARKQQDVGYDEMNDDEEKVQNANFLSQINNLGLNPSVVSALDIDPASDNYVPYRSSIYDTVKQGVILKRYKNFNNPQGNSPVADMSQTYTSVGSSIPESEDINHDNSLNETEAYYQYRVHIKPNMQVGDNYIVDKHTAHVKLPSGRYQDETWYQFKIPIRGYDKAVGGINDFRSIRFFRMFMTGFKDSMVILRFAQLQLDRSNWRGYRFSLINPGENIPEEDQNTTSFEVGTVSLEQNSQRKPVPYIMPPGIQRQEQQLGAGYTQQMDEQSLSLQVCGLKDGDSRAAYKDIGNFDLRQYTQLKMFVHAESTPNEVPLNTGDMHVFVRIGSDFTNNYYEYELPLKITPPNVTQNDVAAIWPEENQIIVELQDFINLKKQRNDQNLPSYIPYTGQNSLGNTIMVVGNPNLGQIKNVMIGIRNPKKTLDNPTDNGLPICGTVWCDELRLTGLNEKPAYAATGQVQLQLADIATINLNASMHSIGYGNIDQKVNERSLDEYYQMGGNINMNVGKLLPHTWGLQLPVYFGYTQTTSNPLYDPYDKDIKLADKMDASSNPGAVRKAAQDFTSITSFNLTNVRYTGNPNATGKPKIPMPWSLKNFDLTYSYNKAEAHNPLIENDRLTTQHLNIGYTYNIQNLSIQPFKKLIKSPSKWWSLIKDFNFSPLPNSFSFRSDMNKVFGETIVRNIDNDANYQIPPYYFKNFLWTRDYNLRWELTKSLSFNYHSNNQSIIDEPYGKVDTKEKRDTLWNNITKFGRNTLFTQTLNATYVVPFKKIPILDWVNTTINYNSTYTWTTASLLAKNLGNTIANTQMKQINGDLNFANLYNKNRWLKAVNRPATPNNPLLRGRANMKQMSMDKNKAGQSTANDGSNDDNKSAKNIPTPKKQRNPSLPPRPTHKTITKKDVKGGDTMNKEELHYAMRHLRRAERKRFRKAMIAWRSQRRNILPEVSDGERFAGGLLTMLKRVNVNYTENQGTTLPGYMDSTRFLGMNNRGFTPGWFAWGYQPDTKWFDNTAADGRISKDSIFNGQLQQIYTQTLNLTATVEPIRDFRIDLNWSKNFTKNHNEVFKYNDGDFRHFTPNDFGTFEISYISLGTLFSKSDPNQMSGLFKKFLDYRKIISRRLGESNPYTNGVKDPNNSDYYKGYTEYSQDVLIPAFIAAYTGRDPENIPLINYDNKNIRSNPFKYYYPLPNWKITYNGLSKLPALQDKLVNFSLTSNYTSKLSLSSFTTNFYYQDLFHTGFPSFIDSVSNNYIPFFQVPNLTITESFAPILGIDAAFKNSLTLRLQFNRTRMISLSLLDYQVSETKSTEIVIGGGYRIKGLQLPFVIFGVRELKNDLNINFDFGLRNDVTNNTYLGVNNAIPTRGQKVLTISPTIDYIINDNLKVQLYYDRRQTVPAVSTSYPITTTRAGLTLTYMFTQ